MKMELFLFTQIRLCQLSVVPQASDGERSVTLRVLNVFLMNELFTITGWTKTSKFCMFVFQELIELSPFSSRSWVMSVVVSSEIYRKYISASEGEALNRCKSRCFLKHFCFIISSTLRKNNQKLQGQVIVVKIGIKPQPPPVRHSGTDAL